MEDVGIDALGGPGRAWLVSAAHPWRHGARRWRLTLAAGGFRSRDGSAFDRSPADADDRQFRLCADLDFR